MRILLTNDDGINAEGLKVLERIAAQLSKDVWIAAPETEQSGASHSLTLHLPVRVRKVEEKRYAISGTPTDCVLLALRQIIPNVPPLPHAGEGISLLLSGVNSGSNVGDDITYSGTVAGAMEGTNLDVPSIALSQLCEDRDDVFWQTAEHFAPDLIKKLLKTGWPKTCFINVNFPDCPPDKVKGVRVCPQGKRLVSVMLSERIDPKGRPYFWLGGERENKPDREGVDLDYLMQGYITVTPIGMDLTDYKTMETLRSKGDI